MRATKVKGALRCPLCDEIIDPDEQGDPMAETTSVYLCPDCGEVTEEPEEFWVCPDCDKIVVEKCPQCDAMRDPVTPVPAHTCPLCDDAVPEVSDTHAFEPLEAWKCGECDLVYDDRDEAKECCR